MKVVNTTKQKTCFVHVLIVTTWQQKWVYSKDSILVMMYTQTKFAF